MSRWPDGPTPLMAARCEGCWFQCGGDRETARRAVELARDALNRELWVACRLAPAAVCAGFYELFSTAALRMAHNLWGFTMVDPPERKEAARGHHRAGRS